MVHGGTLLALGCFQQSPGALLQAVVGTWQWHSIMAFYNLRLLYGAANFKGKETKRGIPDIHAHLKEKNLEESARDQAAPTDWTGKMTRTLI